MYLIQRIFDKVMYFFPWYRSFVNAKLLGSACVHKDRDQYDAYVRGRLGYAIKKKYSIPSVAVILRVKNGAHFLEATVYSVVPLATEIIIIDNASTDQTFEIAKKLRYKLKDKVNIVVFQFHGELEVAGRGYKNRLQQMGRVSLADFYNYCFQFGTSEYLMKVDAHCIYSLNGIDRIQRKIERGCDVIHYRGVEFFGKCLSVEAYCFKRALAWSFVDREQWELLSFASPPDSSTAFASSASPRSSAISSWTCSALPARVIASSIFSRRVACASITASEAARFSLSCNLLSKNKFAFK